MPKGYYADARRLSRLSRHRNLYYRRAGILEGVVERRLAADHVLGLGRHTASSMHNLVCVSE
jgi:hypothetical protein